jgi:17beta-estradiol 17-dehydrogenase / very-long-chain 3-oxoacyl-CoA reductase
MMMINILNEVPTTGWMIVDIIIKFTLIVGMVNIRKTVVEFFRSLYYMIRRSPDLKKKYGENSWAVVTGASDGIGQGFCE